MRYAARVINEKRGIYGWLQPHPYIANSRWEYTHPKPVGAGKAELIAYIENLSLAPTTRVEIMEHPVARVIWRINGSVDTYRLRTKINEKEDAGRKEIPGLKTYGP